MAGDGARVFELDGPQPRKCTGRTGWTVSSNWGFTPISGASTPRWFLRPRTPAGLGLL